jgi:hypothetical protein
MSMITALLHLVNFTPFAYILKSYLLWKQYNESNVINQTNEQPIKC